MTAEQAELVWLLISWEEMTRRTTVQQRLCTHREQTELPSSPTSLKIKHGFHADSKTPASMQQPSIFGASSQDMLNALNPCCVLSSLRVFKSTKKGIRKGTEEKQTWEGQKEEHICSCCWYKSK